MAPSRRTDLPWAVAGALALAVVGGAFFIIRSTGTPAPKAPASGLRPSRVAGFDQIGFAVRGPKGTSARHCALLAATTAQQDRGLMNRTDLAGYDGMIFQFPAPTTTEFYMKDTLISLSIAWFDSSGRFVSATEMTPCPPAAACPTFAAAAPYTVALEVPVGHLIPLGIGTGSTMTVGGSC